MMIQPSITFSVNYVFVPWVVNLLSFWMGLSLKSDRYRYNLFWQLFFILLFTVFLPITSMKSIDEFFKHLLNNEIDDFILQLGSAVL